MARGGGTAATLGECCEVIPLVTPFSLPHIELFRRNVHERMLGFVFQFCLCLATFLVLSGGSGFVILFFAGDSGKGFLAWNVVVGLYI